MATRILCIALTAACALASYNSDLRRQIRTTSNPTVKTIAGKSPDTDMSAGPLAEGQFEYYGTDFFQSAVGGPGTSADDILNTAPRFKMPFDISGCASVDSFVHCDLYVADAEDHRIRKLFMNDKFEYVADTVGGIGRAGFQDSDDGEPQFNTPSGIVVAQNESVAYVADRGNHRIRRVELATSHTSTLAGFSGAVGQYVRLVKPYDGMRIELMEMEVFGPGGARLWPTTGTMSGGSDASLCYDGLRDTLCKTENHQQLEHWLELDFGAQVSIGKIIVVSRANFHVPIHMAGVPQLLLNAEVRVSPLPASINSLLYTSGNVVWSDTISTIAEYHTFEPSVPGAHHDADGTEAQFNKPTGLALSTDQRTLWVSEQGVVAHVIRKIDLHGNNAVETWAGDTPGTTDAIGSFARFNEPAGLVVDPEEPNYLYVADSGNHQIRRVDMTTAAVTTYAGHHQHGWDYLDAVGTDAKMQTPWGLAIHTIFKCDGSSDRRMFVADRSDHRIRVVNMETAQVSTLAGDIVAGFLDGGPFQSRFNNPTGVLVSFGGGGRRSVFVADASNQAVREISFNIKVPTCADPLSHASLSVSSVVPLGAEIHVQLTIDTSYTGQVIGTAIGDWVGLFRAGECADAGQTDAYSISGLHKCHLAWRQIDTPGLTQLSFVFGPGEYDNEPGVYEVRYFTKNSGGNTQESGIVCGSDYGVQGRLSLDGYNSLCWYDVYATSSMIDVGKNTYAITATPDRTPFNGISRDDLQKMVPGLEYESLA